MELSRELIVILLKHLPKDFATISFDFMFHSA